MDEKRCELVEMAVSTNPKPTICRNLYENMGPADSGSAPATPVDSTRPAAGRYTHRHQRNGQPTSNLRTLIDVH